jgi:hypothetical protein
MSYRFESDQQQISLVASVATKRGRYLKFSFEHIVKTIGERRGLNPRIVESQSTALPLGYVRHKK